MSAERRGRYVGIVGMLVIGLVSAVNLTDRTGWMQVWNAGIIALCVGGAIWHLGQLRKLTSTERTTRP